MLAPRLLASCAALTLLASNSLAQHDAMPMGASPMRAKASSPALGGYCPVCVVEMKKWEKGNPSIHTVYDGKTYLFPGADQKRMFDANPAKYVPALGGDCVVCLANRKKRMPGSVRHTALHRGRLYLFPGNEPKQMFMKDPKRYANVDLAIDGKCAVCLAMGHDMKGKPEFTAFHQGMRYLFPSDKERKMFLASPSKFVKKPTSASVAPAGKTPASFVSFTGKSGCAACSYGMRPIGTPENLGLAVAAQDGKVYIVESAEASYPQLYKDRFNGKQLQVQGQVIRQQGRFAWVKPVSVRVIN